MKECKNCDGGIFNLCAYCDAEDREEALLAKMSANRAESGCSWKSEQEDG